MRLGVFRTSSISVLAALLATMEANGESSLLRQGERKLHVTNYPHNHRWPVVTLVPSSLNSEYYTDDLAINDNMIRDKKDLYDQENNQDTNGETQTSVIAALDGSQSLSSSAVSDKKHLLACAIYAGMIGSWLIWWEVIPKPSSKGGCSFPNEAFP